MVKRRQRKNFLPTFILIILLWISWFFMLFFVEPEMIRDILVPGLYLPFLTALFLAIFFTLSVLLVSSRQGLILSSTIIAFLILRLYQVANFLNLFLLLATLFLLELFFHNINKPPTRKNLEKIKYREKA